MRIACCAIIVSTLLAGVGSAGNESADVAACGTSVT